MVTGGRWISDLGPGTRLVDAARRVLSLRLEVVRDALGLALREADKDPEHIHQLRVGTRRAGAALQIFNVCMPEKNHRAMSKHLRTIRRTAGAARDWDVLLLKLTLEKEQRKRSWTPALDFLAGYAIAERDRSMASLVAACPDYPFPLERLIAETLASLRDPYAETGDTVLVQLARPTLARNLHELHLAASQNLHDYNHLHQVRILGKRLRYAMEIFVDCYEAPFKEQLYTAVEEMQDILGRANDSHVASQFLRTLRDRIRVLLPNDWRRLKAGIDGLLKQHEQLLPEERARFEVWWRKWSETDPEGRLGQLVKQPVNGLAEIATRVWPTVGQREGYPGGG